MVRTPPPPLPRLPLPPRPDRPVLRETRERGQSLSDGVLVERTAGSGTEEGDSPDALHAALRLARNPALAAKFRIELLPAGIPRLIRVASLRLDTRDPALHLAGVDPTFLRASAVFFLERVLWFEGGDNFRALGLPPGASHADVAQGAWRLMEWLHPFIGCPVREGEFADRVLEAWQALKPRGHRAISGPNGVEQSVVLSSGDTLHPAKAREPQPA